MECIRLRLEWKIGYLIRKIESVGRIPSKVKWLRKNQSADEFQKMSDLRNLLILKGNQALSRSAPTVILHRTEVQSGQFPNKSIGTNENLEQFPSNSDGNGIPADIDDRPISDHGNGNLEDQNVQCSPAAPPSAIMDLGNIDHKSEAIISQPPTKKCIDCPHCPIKFSYRSSYRRHQRQQHPQFLPIKPKRLRRSSFSIPLILPVFNEDIDDSKPEQDPTNLKEDKMNDKLPRKKCFKCPYCPAKLGSHSSLSSHLKRNRHHQTPHTRHKKSSAQTKRVRKSIPPIRALCPICQKSVQKYLLQQHYNQNHSLEGIDPQTIYKCDDHPNCPAYFRTLLQLQCHKREVHHNNDNIHRTTCPICGRICSEFGNLKLHMKTQHNDENSELPLSCDVVPHCPKRFPSEAILKWHRKYYFHPKVEKSVEIINCPECHRECQGSSALHTHMKIHRRPEAPWICEICGAAFKRKSTLKNHSLFHKGPDNWAFQCEECGKKCATKHRLSEHMKVHSDAKLYSCEVCGNGYKDRQKLRHHVNKFHAKEGFKNIPRKKAKASLISGRVRKVGVE